MQTNTTTTQTTIANNNLYVAFLRQFLYGDNDTTRGAILLHFWSWLKSQKGKRRTYGFDVCRSTGKKTPNVLEYSHLTVEEGKLWIHVYQGRTGKTLWKQPLAGCEIMRYHRLRNEGKRKDEILWV